MNCQQISKYIYQYCEGKVSAELYNEITRHLQECNNCLYNYKLTKLENNVLSDQTDIPTLKSDFSLKVMTQITPDYHNINSLKSRKSIWQKLNNKSKYYLAASVVMVLALLPLHDLLNNQNKNPVSPENIVLSDASSTLRTTETEFKVDKTQSAPDFNDNKTNSSLSISTNTNNKEAANSPAPKKVKPNNVSQDQNNSISNQFSSRNITPETYSPTTIRQESYAEVASRHYQDKLAKSKTEAKPNFIPQNVPMEYKLIKVSILENQNRFVYQNIKSKENLYIEIINKPEARPADNYLASEITNHDTYNYLLKAEVQEDTSSSLSQPLEANKLVDPQIIITSNLDNNPQVIISGNISPDELARLAKIIKIVEEE